MPKGESESGSATRSSTRRTGENEIEDSGREKIVSDRRQIDASAQDAKGCVGMVRRLSDYSVAGIFGVSC